MIEYFDVVDENDQVVGRASRDECHKKRLLHRSVMFFILDKDGKIFVNKRVANKDFFGGQWSIVFGGHVECGERYDTALVREAEEEAGLRSKPFKLGFFKKRLPEERENVWVYGIVAERKPQLPKEEIESGTFMTLAEAEEKIRKDKFIPETLQLLPMLRDYLSKNPVH
ncbi:MAG: NUDIX domain-containing protein [Candidatus Altiarchaeota archaeon]